MGMSHDFEVAIEEGATMVRVGTAIFGDETADYDHEGHSARSAAAAIQDRDARLRPRRSAGVPAEVADDYENALRENDRLRQEVAKLEAVLGEHRGQERNLRNTLLTAQKLADDIKEHAQQRSRR